MSRELEEMLGVLEGENNTQIEDPVDVDSEYLAWKSNCRLMYAKVNECMLDWPSLTVQWLLPKPVEASEDANEVHQSRHITRRTKPLSPTSTHGIDRVLLGTYTGGEEPEYALVNELDGKTGAPTTVLAQLPHDGEVNRLRRNPFESRYLAAIGPTGRVTVYDTETKQTLSLEKHSENSYGLEWDPANKNRLLSGGDDSYVFVWEIDFETMTGKVVHSIKAPSQVNDTTWVPKTPHQIAVACENGNVYLYNIANAAAPPVTIHAHKKPVNSLAFNPNAEHMLATVSSDHTVALWDTRKPRKPLHEMFGHEDAVVTVKWAPFQDGVLATSGADRRVIIWDITRIGVDQMDDEWEDGSPELLFMHGGHRAAIYDFDWHPTQPWMIASVSEDNGLQVWRPNDAALGQLKPGKLPEYAV